MDETRVKVVVVDIIEEKLISSSSRIGLWMRRIVRCAVKENVASYAEVWKMVKQGAFGF